MTSLSGALNRIASDLTNRGVSFALILIGGLAVSARTEPRFTRDLDLAVSVTSDHEAESRVDRGHPTDKSTATPALTNNRQAPT